MVIHDLDLFQLISHRVFFYISTAALFMEPLITPRTQREIRCAIGVSAAFCIIMRVMPALITMPAEPGIAFPTEFVAIF